MENIDINELLSAAEALDRSGDLHAADEIFRHIQSHTVSDTRFAQFDKYSDPQNASNYEVQSAYSEKPGTYQKAPAGYEYSPQGNLQKAGSGKEWEAQQYIQSVSPFALDKDPHSGKPAPAGYEYSPKGHLQAKGYGLRWVSQQVNQQFPGTNIAKQLTLKVQSQVAPTVHK